MQSEFWRDRWEKNEIGFHQADVNRWLTQYWPRLDLVQGQQVLVPLCGKSKDMQWLAERRLPVFGVELSSIACESFFADCTRPYVRSDEARFVKYQSAGLALWCGDFFALTATDLRDVAGVYDRAALVALPPEMRARYAHALIERLPQHVQMLLLTFEYDQSKMSGPPHSVTRDEVSNLFGRAFSMEVLYHSGEVPAPPPMQARGMETIAESVIYLKR